MKPLCGYAGRLILLLALPSPAMPLPGGGTDTVHAAREVYLMGTRCALRVYAPDRDRAIGRLESLLRALEDADGELSTWREDTALGRLNRHPLGRPFPLPAGLCRIWEELTFWSLESGGAFDPAIGCLIDLWGLRGGGRRPSVSELDSCGLRRGLHLFRYDSTACSVVRTAEAWIDSGAFGKGAALDRAWEENPEDGLPWLIDLGGQLMVQGRPPDGRSWPVAVAHPQDRGRAALEIGLDSGSLATSGGSERDLQPGGRRVGHILDPRDGMPALFAGAVTVWHERALVADILSTALYVMGPGYGLPWARERGIAACYLEPDDRAEGGLVVLPSPAFERRFLARPE